MHELEGDSRNGTNGALVRSGGLHDCHEGCELGVKVVWDGKSEGEDHMLPLTARFFLDVIEDLQHYTGRPSGHHLTMTRRMVGFPFSASRLPIPPHNANLGRKVLYQISPRAPSLNIPSDQCYDIMTS